MEKDLYLNDEQYNRLLTKVEELIPQFNSFLVVDSTTLGNKYTTSNVGLCNDELTEIDMALFPELFEKGRKVMKYRMPHQICPFDSRLSKIENDKRTNMVNGCYYTCTLRQETSDKELLLSLVERTKKLASTENIDKRVDNLSERYFKKLERNLK